MGAGHAESLLGFRWFLRDKLIANEPLSSGGVHVALDSTTIYWPSSSLLVPIIDTPGTGDANVLNEVTTEAAIDDAIQQSSQLLVCGTKTLSAEKSVEAMVIRYMQFMIMSKEVTPCIRAVLLPENTGARYTHRTVCAQFAQLARRDQIADSEQQLQKWMRQANEQLAEQHRAKPERLSTLLQRCQVKVAYMNLYASLCLQSHDELRRLAYEAGSDDNPVGVEELLEATGGPWLLGECKPIDPIGLHVCASP